MSAVRLLSWCLLLLVIVVPAVHLAGSIVPASHPHAGFEHHRTAPSGWRSGLTPSDASSALPVGLVEAGTVVPGELAGSALIFADAPFVPPRA